MMLFFRIGLLSALMISCAHRQPTDVAQETVKQDRQEAETLANTVPKVTAPAAHADLNDAETDMGLLPETYNKKVNKWVEYFQTRGRPDMNRYLSRSGRYLPKMKEILRKEGLPEDLVYIALIESGFNSSALSSASAVGYWQFIRGTGRRYGLKQNYYVDDRRDFIHSTKAASQYLKALYNLFGSWYLAIASYNVGENRIKNLVMKHYTRDFWQLAKDKRLPRETENYVPKFLAARMIAKHPQKYGFENVEYQEPLDFKEIAAPSGIDMKVFAAQMGMSYKEFKALNPAYLRGVIPFQKRGTVVRVPSSADEQAVASAFVKSKSSAKMRLAKETRSYRIRRGDTLSHLAQRFGTSIRALRDVNGLNRRAMLYPGKKIKIPGQSVAKASRAVKARGSKKRGEQSYKVRAGDNLYVIAKKFGTSIAAIKKRNGMGRKSFLAKGKTLVIPGSSYASSANSRFHVVRRGDTLSAIAQKYRMKMSKLMSLNDLSRAKTLPIGRKLKVTP